MIKRGSVRKVGPPKVGGCRGVPGVPVAFRRAEAQLIKARGGAAFRAQPSAATAAAQTAVVARRITQSDAEPRSLKKGAEQKPKRISLLIIRLILCHVHRCNGWMLKRRHAVCCHVLDTFLVFSDAASGALGNLSLFCSHFKCHHNVGAAKIDE